MITGRNVESETIRHEFAVLDIMASSRIFLRDLDFRELFESETSPRFARSSLHVTVSKEKKSQ